MGEIRVPIKKTSIEKKNRIIKKGFELMCEKGYYNVTCVDIAKYSDVSTGIIYQYFNDKRDIFLEGVKDYATKIMFPMNHILLKEKINKDNINEILSTMIDNFIKTHTMKKQAHEELMAMSHLDQDVANIFNENEINMTNNIYLLLKNSGFNDNNLKEKIHIIIGIIDNYCHEVVYHKHNDLDYNEMKSEIIKTITMLIAE